MKKIVSTILVCVLLVGTLFALASCGLSGTYEGKLYDLEFSGDQVTFVISDNVKFDASYEITKEDDQEYITFTWAEDADVPEILEGLAGKLKFNEGKDDDGKYIEIGTIIKSKFYKK